MSTPASPVGGLETASDGYMLVLARHRAAAGTQDVSVTITGPHGTPVTVLGVDLLMAGKDGDHDH
jgi:hypothetical protein